MEIIYSANPSLRASPSPEPNKKCKKEPVADEKDQDPKYKAFDASAVDRQACLDDSEHSREHCGLS
jgi:hypothetical protein